MLSICFDIFNLVFDADGAEESGFADLGQVFKSLLHLPSYSRWQQLVTQHTLSALVADLKQTGRD